MVWHPEERDADLPLGWRLRIARQALCPREQISAPAAPAKGPQARARGCSGWAGPMPASPRCVDHAPAACRRVDALSGSSHGRRRGEPPMPSGWSSTLTWRGLLVALPFH